MNRSVVRTNRTSGLDGSKINSCRLVFMVVYDVMADSFLACSMTFFTFPHVMDTHNPFKTSTYASATYTVETGLQLVFK